MSAPRKPRARALSALLKVLAAAVLLALVARTVPWTDRLSWEQDGRTWALRGRIDGDWKGSTVRFEPLDGEELPPGVVLAGGTFPARRGAEEPRVDWRPSLPRVFRDVRPSGLALALGCMGVGFAVTTARWWRLLAAAGCPTTWFNALRLTALGFFFNLVVPGLTGGDVVKAVLAARENPGRRAAAAVSVFVDRILGLLALAVLGAAAVVASGERFAELRAGVLLFLAGGLLAAALYGSRRLRTWARLDALLARLPLGGVVRQIDQAVLLYSRRPALVAGALGLSLLNHLSVIAAFLALGRAFGEVDLRPSEYVVLVSVGNTVSALPLTPGGWGVGEYVFGTLFALAGAQRTLGIAVSVAYRLLMMAIGLAGGAFLLVPGVRAQWSEAERAASAR